MASQSAEKKHAIAKVCGWVAPRFDSYSICESINKLTTWPNCHRHCVLAVVVVIRSTGLAVRFFVYEYVSAGIDPSLPASLRCEGRAMLRAVAEDFTRIAGADVRTLLCSHFDLPAGCQAEFVDPAGEEWAFRRLARWANYTLVVAPEFDDLLHTRCRWVEEENGRLLGPSSPAVALATDKWALAEHLRARGVQTPVCWAFDDVPSRPAGRQYPLVCKPRFGAGSQATFLILNPAA